MLSEVVIASAKASQVERRPGLSISGLFPCPYYIYKSFVGWGDLPQREGEEILNMENGWFQEDESIKALKRAGIIVENRQRSVWVGKARVPGHIDGTVTVSGRAMLWEHKAKSMDASQRLKERKLDSSPDIKTQVQLYMKGLKTLGEEFTNLDEADIYIKQKDTNTPFDFVVKYEPDFADMVVEWVDRVVLDKWAPEPKECLYCSRCYMRDICRGETILDLSGVTTWDNDELVKRWRLGKQYSDFGKELVESSRTIFKAKFEESSLEAGDVLMVGPLRVKKYVAHKRAFNQVKFIEKFGALALLDVTEEQEIPGYRVDDTEGGQVK